MSSAAELLRSLSRDPITTFDADVVDRLLPLLAALVEAVVEWRIAGDRHCLEHDYSERVARSENGVIAALDALNAAAAKEAK